MALWMLLAVVLVTVAVFAWTSTHYKQGGGALDTRVDAAGHLHVLGVTLGETSLREAEHILQSKSDVALYIYPQGDPKAGLKLEAFFPAIADHTKVILLLDPGEGALKALESRATVPHLYPNNVARMNLAPEDYELVHAARVRELTLIPNLHIDAATLKARFGEPDRVERIDQQRQRLVYDAIGLSAELAGEGPPLLHFVNPQ
jgi:hypothetical protein